MSSPRTSRLENLKRVLRRTRRWAYGLRTYVPGLRRQHYLEVLIGPVGYWKALARYQLHLLQANGLRPGHALLDVGCGPLQGGIPFIRYLNAGDYIGVDITQERYEVAREEIARHHLADRQPRLILAEDFGETQLGAASFDFIWASQVLYLFPEQLLHAIVALAHKRLRPGGKFLGDIIHPDHFEAQFYPNSGFLLHPVEELQQIAEVHGMQARSLGPIAQYHYPRQLTLRTNLLIEFTRKQ